MGEFVTPLVTVHGVRLPYPDGFPYLPTGGITFFVQNVDVIPFGEVVLMHGMVRGATTTSSSSITPEEDLVPEGRNSRDYK